MDAGTHATMSPTGNRVNQGMPPAPAKQKWLLVFAGTATAVLVAGILYQVSRPAPGTAAEQQVQERSAAKPGKATLGESVARVNNELISEDDVARECMLSYGNEVLEKMINRKIIEQACATQGVNVTEAEVDSEILKIATKFKMPLEQWYTMLQTERSVTPAQYRRDIIWPMLALKKLAGEKVQITEEEMDHAFIRNYGERMKVKVIVVDNLRRATECWEKVHANPESFSQMVREYSSDPSSRPLDGSVPPIRRYSGTPGSVALEEAAFKLKKGQISAVIETAPSQYVIMLCEGKTKPVVEKMEDVEEQLRQDLTEEKVQKSVSEVFERLKEDARIDNFLTGKTMEPKKKGTAQKAGSIRQTGAKSAGKASVQGTEEGAPGIQVPTAQRKTNPARKSSVPGASAAAPGETRNR